MAALARTPVLPEATPVAVLSARLRRSRPGSATSAIRRLRAFHRRRPWGRCPPKPEVQTGPLRTEGSNIWGVCAGSALVSPTGGQLVQASQDKGLPPIGMLDVIQLQIGQPAQQRADCDFSLDAGELGAEAVMDAATE